MLLYSLNHIFDIISLSETWLSDLDFITFEILEYNHGVSHLKYNEAVQMKYMLLIQN